MCLDLVISQAKPTLHASLFGSSLQTLPKLVTPLKRHSLFPCDLYTDAVSALRKVWVLKRLEEI